MRRIVIAMSDPSSQSDNVCSSYINSILNRCLLDKLKPFYRNIGNNPILTFVVLIVIYMIFVLIYLPFYLVSLLITPYGAIILLLYLFYLLAKYIAGSIAFPGSTKSLQREYSADYMKRFASSIDIVVANCSQLTASFMLILSGRIVKIDKLMLMNKLHELNKMVEVIPRIIKRLDDTIRNIEPNKNITPDDLNSYRLFKNNLEIFTSTYHQFSPLAMASLNGENDYLVVGMGVGPKEKKVSNALVVNAGDCLKASEQLKSLLFTLKGENIPVNGNSDIEAANNSPSSHVMKVLSSITKYNVGPTGYQKLAFPLMREQLKEHFGGERILLTGVDSNIIDGFVIPSMARLKSSTPDCEAGNSSLSLGVVLFCSPNAGLYECASLALREASWIGFYTTLGFDICLYNYRGYNESSGVASPDALKKDGEIVYNYLKNGRSSTYQKILIHGESIGGLVACHIAKSCSVDALICDRTFSSLDATAARLLGSWASIGLRNIVLWSTNVTADYLQCTCPFKLLLQDPNDEVIHHQSSLKNGIASYLLMGENKWLPSSMPHDYTIAEALNQQLPNIALSYQYISDANDLATPLKHSFFVHLFGCISYLIQQIHAHRATNERDSNISSAASPNKARPFADEKDESDDDDDGIISDIVDSNAAINNPEKIWSNIFRVNGGCGQMLGHAILYGGLDGLRDWICSYIVWSPRSYIDNNVTNQCIHLPTCIQNLTSILHDMEKDRNTMYETLNYIIQAFHIVQKRAVESEAGITSGFYIKNNSLGNNNTIGDTTGIDIGVGALISVHNGHNGWPSSADIYYVKSFIHKAGFPV